MLTTIARNRNGVALLAVTVSVIILAIGLSVALPRVDHEITREKEDSLRFALGEFRRAVAKYQRCHQALPENIEVLLDDGQGNRFLRRRYIDPFTGKFDWVAKTGSGTFVIHSASAQKSLSGAPYSEFR
ncbi:MAG: ral secretion pathway protein [Clostridiales bacterium]|jgi:type II secretory pathway pseudopilin PulG|nr:ral secretion pathway protein [Clostridiales bacterium]MDN5281652.1 ral secretion pathway protein [Candidatus Ozemobacter sp.]